MLPYDALPTALYRPAPMVGSELPFEYFGPSCVCGPTGADLARGGNEEATIFADLDRAALAAARKSATTSPTAGPSSTDR